MRKFYLWAFFALFLGVITLAINFIWFKPLSFRFFTEREFIILGLHDPELMSHLGILDNTPFDFYNDKLTDASLEQIGKQKELARKSFDTLRAYDRNSLSVDEQFSRDILFWYLNDIVRGEKYALHHYVITQNTGAYLSLVDLMSRVHRVDDIEGAENYLSRLAQIQTKLDQQLAVANHQASIGVIPPSFIVRKVLMNLHNIRDVPPEQSLYFTAFTDKLAKLDDLSVDQQNNFKQSAHSLIVNSVYPAYDRHIAYFESLKKVANDEAGVWKLPDGDNYYQHQIQSSTSTNMTAQEIHELGLEEVARIESEMKVILSELGYDNGTPAEIMTRISTEPRFVRPDTFEERKALLVEYQQIENEISAGMGDAFNTHPKATLEVRQIPAYQESTAATHYSPPSLNGSRPGVFFVNLKDIPPPYAMRTLAYHEGIPGHHFQIGLQSEQVGVPTFRKVLPFTAFVEGWALYAERLAWELGFGDDPFDNLGRLNAELFRAARLVVDTGIHFKRWSRQEAMDYFHTHTGKENEAEIERYIVWPGQALAYKVGMLKILTLREQARTAMGEEFDLGEFHDVIIGDGAMPFDVLEQRVRRYIAGSKPG